MVLIVWKVYAEKSDIAWVSVDKGKIKEQYKENISFN